jgi:hypothetical protein
VLLAPGVARAQTVDSLAPDTTAVPIPTFQTVTWTAAASGGTGPLSYQFWRFDAATGWTLAQDYSSSATYTWTPGLGEAGEHALQVWVRNAGSTAVYDAWGGTGMFLVGPRVTLHANPPAPIADGATITWTAAATGFTRPVYEFWRYDSDRGWALARPYDTASTYMWQTTPGDRSDHAVQVWVSESDLSPLHYDAWAGTEIFHAVDPQPIAVPAPTPLSALPAPAGVPLTFSAPATGGIAPLEYAFWRFDSDKGWTRVQDYGPSSTYTWWTPGVTDVGQHALQVWVRSMGSTAAYEGWSGTGLFDVDCPTLTLSADDNFYRSDRPPSIVCTPPSCALSGTALTGTLLTLKANTCGGTGAPLEFQFWRTKVGVTDWEVVQDFGGPDTFTWLPDPSEAGLYIMQARARRVGFASVTAFEAIDSKEFSVRTPAADLEVAVTSPPGTVHAGTSLSVSEVVRNVGVASSSSCTLSYALDSVVIGSRVVPALAPGTESAATVTLAVPARTGAFYLTLQHNCTSDLSVWNNLTSIAVRVIP